MSDLLRLPRSCQTRCGGTYIKVVRGVRCSRETGWYFDGTVLTPGARVTPKALWPDDGWPRPALLLEHAGNPNPARGWNRHKQEDVYILWTIEPGEMCFHELVRGMMPPGTWGHHLGPIARDFLESRGFGPPRRSVDEIKQRVFDFLEAELDAARPGEAPIVLGVIHDQIAGRLCEFPLKRVA